MLDVDASVKCIVNEIARRFDDQIPGMKPSRSSSLKLNTSKFDHKCGSSDGRLCSNCGAGSSSTPLMRRGPDGVRSLCNACGLWYARRGTQRPIEGGSVAEREAEKAAIALKLNQGKPSSAAGNNTNNFAHGEQAEAGKEENDEEHKRKDEKTAEEKERLARIVPKIETLSGLAVFGYHEHVVQEALRAHVIAKYAPLLGIDLLTSTGLHKYGRYESSSGKTEQRRSSKRERKEISKFVDEAAFTANKAPQKRKNAATGIAKAAATKKIATASAAVATTISKSKQAGMRKNSSDRSIADQFFGLSDSFHEPTNDLRNDHVVNNTSGVNGDTTVADDLQQWENLLFNNSFGEDQNMYTNFPRPGYAQPINNMYIAQHQQAVQHELGNNNIDIQHAEVPRQPSFRIGDESDLLEFNGLNSCFMNGTMF